MAADTQTDYVLPNAVYIQFAADIALSDGTQITVDNQFSHNNIEQIEFADGTVLALEKERITQKVLDPQVHSQMQGMLNRVVTSGTGKKVADVPHVRGGKTGTSNENRDAWFVGFTRKYTTGVWVGNDHNQSLGRSESGGATAAPIWRDFMVSIGK